MSFNSMKIGTRLGLGIGAAALMLAGTVWLGVAKMHEIKGNLDVIAADRLPKIVAIKDAKDNIRERASLLRTIALLDDEAQIKAQIARLAVARTEYQKLEQQLTGSIKTVRGMAGLAVVREAVAALVSPTDQVIALGAAGKNTEATGLLLGTVAARQEAALQALEALSRVQIEATEEFQHAAANAYASALMLMLALGAVAIALMVGFGWVLVRSITAPLALAVKVSQAVASGDLTMSSQAEGRDETADLLRSLERMRGNLADVVDGVRRNSESVATASAQISQGNSDLSSRTEQQASALEQTAASMEELSSTVKQNADNARQANQLAMGASSVAITGGQVVGDVVLTMKSINESSGKISQIIGVIDGIAFQTNILALNAAVEAARAGEQGRGFAVVATEVRTLAKRSAEAAKEIKSLIATSVERVEQGTQLVDKAGATMTEVVASIRRVTDIMGEISAASAEQSSGVSQIGEAVGQMDQATQQNAALVEESAAAAESLSQQAGALVQSVAVFTLPSKRGAQMRP